MLLKYCEVNGHAKKAYRCCCGFEEMEISHWNEWGQGTRHGRPINLKINQIAFRVNRVRPIRFESLESVKGQDTEIRIGAMIAQYTMHRS